MSARAAAAHEPDRRPDEQPQQGAGSAAQSAPPQAGDADTAAPPTRHAADTAPPPRPPATGATPPRPPASDGAPFSDARQGAPAQRHAADPHADFLITSADRDSAEARLRQAVADDAIDLDEFGERMRAVLEARTRGDLQQATAGVPTAAEPIRRTRERGTARPAREQGFVVAIMSGTETRGRWRPARTTTALAVMGGTVIDLQGAEFDGDELTINALALMGGVEIVVPEGVEVELSGFAIMGGRDNTTRGAAVPDAPLVRVQGYALMGGIEVRNPKKRDRRYVDGTRGAFADRVPLRSADHRADRGYGGQTDERQVRHRTRASLWSKVRRRAGGLLVAAALLVPLGWAVSSDEVAPALFGSQEQTISAAQLEGTDELTVGVPAAFGSVEITVPEGVNVERDGIIIFGSTSLDEQAAPAAADAPTVTIRSVGAFSSIDVVVQPTAGDR